MASGTVTHDKQERQARRQVRHAIALVLQFLNLAIQLYRFFSDMSLDKAAEVVTATLTIVDTLEKRIRKILKTA